VPIMGENIMKIKLGTIYSLVDENYISKFKGQHLYFMKEYYYSEYCNYCKNNKLLPLDKSIFFSNMRKRNIKIIQMCCPFCGSIKVIIKKCSIKEVEHYKYCPNCGKSSAFQNVFFQLSRILRIIHFHSVGLEMIKEKNEDHELKILTYDIYQLELVEIASILEVTFRDFFNSFLFIRYFNIKDDYLSKVIDKNTGNDFLNIEKANTHFKRALNINLREKISESNWLDLIDLVNMRNTIVHNNGVIDVKFKNTKTYTRLKDIIKGELLFLDAKKINYYIRIVCEVVETIAELFEEKFDEHKYSIITNFYFNHKN